MNDINTLPLWQSHKIVRAAKIRRVSPTEIHLLIPGGDGQENTVLIVTPAANMFARYMPVEGDYYVVYEDGYASISPRVAFEAGYHAL